MQAVDEYWERFERKEKQRREIRESE